MLNIINDIVDISKIEAGLIDVSNTESDINEQTAFIYTFFKPQAINKGLAFRCKNGLPSPQAFYTDKEKLYAILTNLVKNAIKFTDTGSIEFGYETMEHAPLSMEALHLLQFYVKDTGIGIPADRQQAIFDRFVQADIADSRAFQGAGLGLSISKAYVEMLGGNIWVESEEGKGSTFYFTIPYNPVKKENIKVTNLEPPLKTEPQGRNLKILVAEDDFTSSVLISIALKGVAKQILQVNNGVAAVEACLQHPDIDLVMMDVKMPKMDGYEAAREIRQFNKNVVIIAQTAYAMVLEREKAMEAGCNDYISKPINVDLLKGLVQKYFPD
jgi:hypothetical protein